jgi:hypothetical protein
MKISAFGHAHEKVAQLERILTDGFKRSGGALLAYGSGRDYRRGRGLSNR